jgi:GDP-4-dehydro-6-deoxy-D-mannose reductase
MTKYLITGSSGFVARHFIAALRASGEPCHVLGIDRNIPDINFDKADRLKFEHTTINLLDNASLTGILNSFKPDFIIHLASFSSVASSWQDPVGSYQNNTNIFLNIVESMRQGAMKCRILSVGSSEEYGDTAAKISPLTEDSPLNPGSPYAVARVSQEMLGKLYAQSFGLDIVMTRSFNHLGPGQKENFFIPSVVKQICTAKKLNGGPCRLKTGNISLIRDFSDARDVVAAYLALIQKGKSGEIYNICSGQGVKLSEIIAQASAIAGVAVEIEQDPALLRPHDIASIIGSHRKLSETTGWKPEYTLRQSLGDIVAQYEDSGAL